MDALTALEEVKVNKKDVASSVGELVYFISSLEKRLAGYLQIYLNLDKDTPNKKQK